MEFVVDLRHKTPYQLFRMLKTLPDGTLDLSDLEKKFGFFGGFKGNMFTKDMPPLDRLNRVRLDAHIRSTIEDMFKTEVGQPFDKFEQLRFKSILEEYLQELKARRALVDFMVVCDDRNNSPMTQAEGLKIMDIHLRDHRGDWDIDIKFSLT